MTTDLLLLQGDEVFNLRTLLISRIELVESHLSRLGWSQERVASELQALNALLEKCKPPVYQEPEKRDTDPRVSGYFHEHPIGVYRDSTLEEIVQAKATRARVTEIDAMQERLKKERQAIMDACQHYVSQDTEGWPYDIRACIVCGHGGLI